MTKEQIENEIADLRKQMQEVKGTKCEVWSRVVGYLRPVQNYNKGKQAEYGMRKPYNIVK